MKVSGSIWLAALVALCLAGCGQPDGGETSEATTGESVRGVSSDEVVLGVHTDLSGPTAIWGVGATNGARMRFDAANAAGGVHGRQIRYVVEDAQYQIPRAIQAANKLINRDEVLAMVLAVGTPTNNAIMTQQFEQGVPNLFPITGARSMVEPLHPWKFTQRGIYYYEVRAAVRYFIEEQGKSAVCAIYQDTDYGQEIFEGMKAYRNAADNSVHMFRPRFALLSRISGWEEPSQSHRPTRVGGTSGSAVISSSCMSNGAANTVPSRQ